MVQTPSMAKPRHMRTRIKASSGEETAFCKHSQSSQGILDIEGLDGDGGNRINRQSAEFYKSRLVN